MIHPQVSVVVAEALEGRSAEHRLLHASSRLDSDALPWPLIWPGSQHVAGSDEPVAESLVLSPRTIGTHVEHILSKLGVRNRVQAVALAYRDEVIGPELQAPAGGNGGVTN